MTAAWKSVAAALALAMSGWGAQAQTVGPPSGPERFAPEIQAFAAADRAAAPAPCGYLFVGSSSVRRWTTLTTDLAPLPVLNRGFGGSTIADVDFYFDQVVKPYRPRAIVFYAGENDLAAGKSPEQVTADFRRFLALKDQALGATPVYFVSLKPSKLREAQMAKQAEVNAAVQALAKARKDLRYIDVVAPMLQEGKPKDIFVEDGLHMTPAGYEIWTAVIKPVLEKDLAERPDACKAA